MLSFGLAKMLAGPAVTPKLGRFAALFAAGLIIGWWGNGARLNAQIDRIIHESDKAMIQALNDVLAENERMAREKQKALDAAQADSLRNARAAARAGVELDRLRSQVSQSRAALANSTQSSIVEYASALSDVFEQCTREYTEVAKKADGHALDAQLLFNAWTAIRNE